MMPVCCSLMEYMKFKLVYMVTSLPYNAEDRGERLVPIIMIKSNKKSIKYKIKLC